MSKRVLNRLVRMVDNSNCLEDVLYSMLLLQELGAYVDSRELVNRDQVLGEIQGLISRCEGRLDDSFQSVRSFVGAFLSNFWTSEEALNSFCVCLSFGEKNQRKKISKKKESQRMMWWRAWSFCFSQSFMIHNCFNKFAYSLVEFCYFNVVARVRSLVFYSWFCLIIFVKPIITLIFILWSFDLEAFVGNISKLTEIEIKLTKNARYVGIVRLTRVKFVDRLPAVQIQITVFVIKCHYLVVNYSH